MKNCKKPRALLPNDKIALVAPAATFDRADFEKGVATLRNLGFNPVYDDSIFAKHLYLAGPDRHRTEQLVRYLTDDSVRAVFCARGGYGSTRLLPALKELRWESPKILMGCSDITALLAFFTSEQNWVTFHGPMVAGDIAATRIDVAQWAAFLGGGRFPVLLQSRAECWKPGKARGVLYGGCLSILCSLPGTGLKWQLESASDLILFVEDVRCRAYQIDRMLTQLKQTGLFDRVRGLIFGEMIECDGSQSLSLKSVVLDVLSSCTFPVMSGFPSGHTTAENLILPFGVHVEMDASTGCINFEESPVIA
ncbi:MAG TPA: LD-carboxypeptidase [Acidobacteriota bacterium]